MCLAMVRLARARTRHGVVAVLAAVLSLVALSMPVTVLAHALAPSLLDVKEIEPGRTQVLWKTPARKVPGSNLTPVMPIGCAHETAPKSEVVDTAIVTRWTMRCEPAQLVGRTFLVEGIASSKASVLFLLTLADGNHYRSLLRADAPTFVVPKTPLTAEVVGGYARLGVEHILTGFDHLLFVLGLMLLIADRRALIWTITSFTAGHSVTLSMAALELVSFPSALIEVAIALSIFLLAVELARSTEKPTLLRRYPWAMAFTFGLLHGLGFAGALMEIGLPKGDIPLSLASFNVGIELGQIGFVSLLWLLAALATRVGAKPTSWLRQVPVYAIGSLGVFWFLERVTNLA